MVLLDEIEKAHPEVFNVLLQVLDEGRLTDSKGRTVNFKNTIIIMTSNLGSHLIQEKLDSIQDDNRGEIMGEMRMKIFEMLRQTIRPEFLNRIDEIVLFQPLTTQELRSIVSLQLREVQKMASAKNITLTFSDELTSWLVQIGYDPAFGARPLKRTIQKYVVNAISERILSGTLVDGDSMEIGLGDRGEVEFVITAKAEVV